jgi:uncharacterized protein YkwD
MSFGILLTWLTAWPMLILPLLGIQTGGTTTPSPSTKLTVSSPAPARSATPRSSVKPSTTPKPSAAPKPTSSSSPAAGEAQPASEIASDQVCPGQADVSKTTSVLVCLTSHARGFHGLKPVSGNSALMAAAAAKDQDMKTCGYGHTACGRDFGYWIKAKGYSGRCYGENIAMGQKSPREVFMAWMNSPGHRANILSADYRDLGVAELAGAQGPLWAMELGGC